MADTFNGKPMSYWEAQARPLVVETLVRAWEMYERRPGRNVSIIHEIAAKQFIALARGVSERDCEEVIATMGRCRARMARTLAEIVGPGKRKAASKSARKRKAK